MRYLFTTGLIEPEELLILFQKKQENEFISLNLAIMLNCGNEKVNFVVFHVKDVNKLVPYHRFLKPVFWEISLTKKVIKLNQFSVVAADTRAFKHICRRDNKIYNIELNNTWQFDNFKTFTN